MCGWVVGWWGWRVLMQVAVVSNARLIECWVFDVGEVGGFKRVGVDWRGLGGVLGVGLIERG